MLEDRMVVSHGTHQSAVLFVCTEGSDCHWGLVSQVFAGDLNPFHWLPGDCHTFAVPAMADSSHFTSAADTTLAGMHRH